MQSNTAAATQHQIFPAQENFGLTGKNDIGAVGRNVGQYILVATALDLAVVARRASILNDQIAGCVSAKSEGGALFIDNHHLTAIAHAQAVAHR